MNTSYLCGKWNSVTIKAQPREYNSTYVSEWFNHNLNPMMSMYLFYYKLNRMQRHSTLNKIYLLLRQCVLWYTTYCTLAVGLYSVCTTLWHTHTCFSIIITSHATLVYDLSIWFKLNIKVATSVHMFVMQNSMLNARWYNPDSTKTFG